MRGSWVFVAAALATAGAQAQRSAELRFGVRYWVGSGSRTAPRRFVVSPPSRSIPTSTLTYSDLGEHARALRAQALSARRWFAKGKPGRRQAQHRHLHRPGLLIDQRPAGHDPRPCPAGSGKLQVRTIDVGRDLWQIGNATVALFAGYQPWSEQSTATASPDSFGSAQPGPGHARDQQRADLEVIATRGGGARRARAHALHRSRSALVPYAEYRNEDSHLCASTPGDLGPVPT